MDWNPLLATHVVGALVALVIGPVNILRRRRDRTHRILGYSWAASMYYVCMSSFWIVTDGHYSWLHGLSAFTLVTVTLGVTAAIRRNIRAHMMNMVGSYLGLLVAFIFAATVPARAIPRLLVSDPGTAIAAGALVVLSVVALYLTLEPHRRRSARPLGGVSARTDAPAE